MNFFPIGTSTEILFGEGSKSQIFKIINKSDVTNILVVLSATSLLRKEIVFLINSLKKNYSIIIFNKVEPNPRSQDIDECLNIIGTKKISHIVGIGGGSAMDQAKAIAMCLSLKKNIYEAFNIKEQLPKRNNKLILLPTTSGTGAELSFGSILTDIKKTKKIGLRGKNLASDFAIIDPELTYSLSEKNTMITGFDVLTHALETYISKDSNFYIEQNSSTALKKVFEWLPVLKLDPKNTKARKEMSFASMLMGINLALSSTCLPHRMQYPIGAITDTPHALGLAAIYPSWLNHLLPFCPHKLSVCSNWINIKNSKNSDLSNAKAFIQNVNSLIGQIGLDINLVDIGLNKKDISKLVHDVNGDLNKDPSFIDQKDLEKIYMNSLTFSSKRKK
jgi:alcohol dehydrogenase class IV